MQQVLLRIKIPEWIPEGNPFFGILFLAALAFIARALLIKWQAKRGQPAAGHSQDISITVAAAMLFAAWRGALWARANLPEGIPIYGFGMMLFLALVICTWLAGRRAEAEGVRKEILQDLAIYLCVGGILGARLASVIADGVPLVQFFRIWDGGMILYGSVLGGLAGYALAYFLIIRKNGLTTWQLADILAPSIAIGIALGRVGCFLNGCCFGQVACPHCVQVGFPLSSPPRFLLVKEGYQTPAGFTMSDLPEERLTVGAVDSASPAAAAGLKDGDVLVKLRDFAYAGDERALNSYIDLEGYLGPDWPRGKNSLALTVRRGAEEIPLPAFAPRTLGLLPTQPFESISMVLLFCLLTAYFPFRRRPGEVMAILMFCYGLHRFLNEMLRGDPRPITLEVSVSIVLFVLGLGLWIWLRWVSMPARKLQGQLTAV